MNESLAGFLGIVASLVVLILLVLTALKVIWNFGLPYAMLRHPEKEGWSIFPLIEILPLLVALMISWASGLEGLLDVRSVGWIGCIAIVASYVHLFLAPVGYGVIVHGLLGRSAEKTASRQEKLPM